MADQIVHEMIAAFSVGCMDKQNFIQFKEYMQQDGELPQGELGELQNIVAMIPIILDIENPHPSIKDKVAKRLIELKDEIKAKILSERRSSSTFSKTSTAPIADKTEISFKSTKPLTQTFGTRFTNVNLNQTRKSKDDFAEYLEKRKTKIKTEADFIPAPLPPEKEDTFEFGKDKLVKETVTKTENKPSTKILETIITEEEKTSSWMGILSLIITIILVSVLGYYTFINIQKLNNTIADLQNEITSLKSQVNSANNFVENYSALVEFFNNKDIIITNLQSVNDSIPTSAKLLLSFSDKSGLIQFKNPKQLTSDKIYQLWAVRRNQSVSMGSFKPIANEFLRINQFPPMPKDQIDYYKVTLETGSEKTEPSANILLISQQIR